MPTEPEGPTPDVDPSFTDYFSYDLPMSQNRTIRVVAATNAYSEVRLAREDRGLPFRVMDHEQALIAAVNATMAVVAQQGDYADKNTQRALQAGLEQAAEAMNGLVDAPVTEQMAEALEWMFRRMAILVAQGRNLGGDVMPYRVMQVVEAVTSAEAHHRGQLENE